MLEVGCGNGLNCLAMAEAFPESSIDGIDFVTDMVASAQALVVQRGLDNRVHFTQGDALELAANTALREQYDVVFTVRCLINLPEPGMQLAALASMSDRLAPGGSLIVLENNTKTYGNQNRLRGYAGLVSRVPDTYNCFMDEDAVLVCAGELGLTKFAVEDFASLHDIVLYVLLPAVNGGVVEYDHPLVEAAKQVQLGSAGQFDTGGTGPFGPFGQNRLYHWRKSL